MGKVWDVELPCLEKMLLLALADHANDEDFTCWPSLSRLTKKSGLDRSTVKRKLSILIEKKFISRAGFHEEAGSRIYKINAEKFTEAGVHSPPGQTAPRRTQPFCQASTAPRGGVHSATNHNITIIEPSLGEKEKNPKKTKRPKTLLPDDFEITDHMSTWAAEKVPGVDIGFETEKFIDSAKTHDRVYSDWTGAWRNWMRGKFEGKFEFKSSQQKSTSNSTASLDPFPTPVKKRRTSS